MRVITQAIRVIDYENNEVLNKGYHAEFQRIY